MISNRISAGLLALSLASFSLAQSTDPAAALYAAGEWQQAADAFQAQLAENGENANAWFGLAQSRHQLQQYPAAIEAYRKAADNGFQPPGRVQFHLARALASDGQTDAAIATLDALPAGGGVNNRLLLATSEFAALAGNERFDAVLTKLTPCTSEQHRAFDFWVGQWDVTSVTATSATAFNDISLIQQGCAVLEQYHTLSGGYTGTSISFYDQATGRWHQSWIDNNGGTVYFEGGLVDGAMVLSDEGMRVSEEAGVINRTTWTPLDDGRVRQHWEQSSDQGETWTTAFDGYYARTSGED